MGHGFQNAISGRNAVTVKLIQHPNPNDLFLPKKKVEHSQVLIIVPGPKMNQIWIEVETECG